MDDKTATCPFCEAEARLLARLGRMDHYRCGGCRRDFRAPAPVELPGEAASVVDPAEPLPEALPMLRPVRVAVLER